MQENKNEKDYSICSFVICVSGGVSACAPTNRIRATRCTPLPPVPVCTGNSSNPKVTINMTCHTVAPPNVCAQRGKDIEFKVIFGSVTEAADTVGTLSKNLKNLWLAVRNTPDPKTFTITAPSTDGEYDYSALFADGQCRDPRISVSRD
jgi:hypothetical protein